MPMGNGTMHKMWMFLHAEPNDTLLFSFWTVQTAWGMVASCILLFMSGLSFELLKWIRLVLEQRGERSQPSANRRYAQSLLTPGHLLQTALFGLQLLLSYLLMLAVMTFSIWVLVAVCTGAAAGFWLFGRRQPVIGNGRPNPEIH